MRTGFVTEVFEHLLGDGALDRTHTVLAVAGGTAERDLFAALGLSNATITNLDDVQAAAHLAPFEWAHQDAQQLSYDDRSFDWVVVVDGLHHCTSPHKALCEMYRVSRRGVVVVESRNFIEKINIVPAPVLERVAAQCGQHFFDRAGAGARIE